jgi:hypothetical protein
MNRKVFLIAVVAVVAIGIVAGVLLSGAGRTGPLAGAIVPDQGGCVGSQLDAKYHRGVLKTTVWGTLRNLDGTPMPGEWVYVYECGRSTCNFFVGYPLQTDADGRFQVTKPTGGVSAPFDISVLFEYGVVNGMPCCKNWATAKYSMTGP